MFLRPSRGGCRSPSIFSRFRRCRAGNAGMIFALTLIPLAGIVGAALDYSLAITARGKLQAASDTAALAAAKALTQNPGLSDAELNSIAAAVFNTNTGNIYQAKNIGFNMSRLQNGVSITANAEVETNVIGILGIDKVDVAAKSETQASTTRVEVAMVLDNTGSMAWSGKMGALKDAANTLVNTLIPGNSSDFVKIGLVPYDITVNIGTGYVNAPWLSGVPSVNWCGLVKIRKAPDDTLDTAPTGSKKIKAYYKPCGSLRPLQPLINQKSTLTASINAMQPNGWTYIPAGLIWGWRMLSPSEPLTEGTTYNDPDWKKVLILMTDGDNTAIWKNTKVTTNVPSTQADAKTRTLCDNIKDKGIKIYSIAFQLTSSTSTNLLRDCATTSGDFFAAHTNDDLRAAFSSIAGDINKLRLSK
ncbi:MAG: hypothetical protein C0605_00970 [Hyphomicrobiales bacterium]|nr:MAG: hypothetical protein C0605_00970 [Hyphomicrobiales bacterium]